MEVEFSDDDYDRLETDPKFSAGFAGAIVTAYRKKLFFIRNAQDERDLYSSRGLNFEQLKGERSHQHSIRLNKQWRLILEMHGKGAEKVIRVIKIENHYE
jgi:proteic killer suppression protein